MSDKDRPTVAKRHPRQSRKVWVEVYPGGDIHIELGHMNTVDLYLTSKECAALREMLGELYDDEEDDE